MVIAVPKEILPGENRVGITPDVASKLIKKKFQVHVQKGAGLNAGYTDDQYEKAGAKLYDKLTELYASADIIAKVQRPMDHPEEGKHELDLMKEGTILITFLYSLNYPELAKKCAEKKLILSQWMQFREQHLRKNGRVKFTSEHSRIQSRYYVRKFTR